MFLLVVTCICYPSLSISLYILLSLSLLFYSTCSGSAIKILVWILFGILG